MELWNRVLLLLDVLQHNRVWRDHATNASRKSDICRMGFDGLVAIYSNPNLANRRALRCRCHDYPHRRSFGGVHKSLQVGFTKGIFP